MLSVQYEDFDLAKEYACLKICSDNAGALVMFVGLVRDLPGGLLQMTLEHYPKMTEDVLTTIIAMAKERWPLQAVRIVHRVGNLQPGDQIVFVGVASAHRAAAFSAAEFIMDYLKTQAPLWKKERKVNGEHWVEAKVADEQALKKWIK
jgi:molybdopterin synthase catalytic subunit